VPIPFSTATLGGHIEVPTIDGGRVKVTVPEGTQTGHQLARKAQAHTFKLLAGERLGAGANARGGELEGGVGRKGFEQCQPHAACGPGNRHF
jgi:hypothetical protein